MPITQNQGPNPNHGTPSPTPQGPPLGSWQPSTDQNHPWVWNPTAPADPALVQQWGNEALTDIRRDPLGNLNHGTWTPVHGGGWRWWWGGTPDPSLLNSWSSDQLTDPHHLPGQTAPVDNSPPPPDVHPPALNDIWHGIPPNVTGDVPPPPAGTAPLTTPPVHPAFMVSPGGIRDVETTVLASIDTQLTDFNALESKVADSKSQNVYTTAVREQLINAQDRMLLQIGDTLHMAGQFVQALNGAAQSYAKADIDSFVPEN